MSSPIPVNSDQIQALLNAYEFGKLSEDEHQILMNAALDNPAVFEQLWHATRHREYLSNSNVRQKLAAACLQEPKAKSWLSSWQLRLGVPMAAAAALAIFLTVRPAVVTPIGEPKMVPMSSPPAAKSISSADVLFATPLPSTPISELQFEDLGPSLRFTATLPLSATLFIFRRLSGQSPELVWPPDANSTAAPPGGKLQLTFDKTTDVQFRVFVSLRGADLRRGPAAALTADPDLQMQSFRFPNE